jgi:nitrogen regulatory protein P-II 1
MQLVRSIIRPDKVDVVKHALEGIGVSGMTIIEVRGLGKEKGRTAVYRGQEYAVTLLPKMLVECVVPDHLVDCVIKTVIESARTGQLGDGRVFVIPVTASYRIRTGERD